MSARTIRRLRRAPFVLAAMISITGCSNHTTASVLNHSFSAPVYPNAKIETAERIGLGDTFGQAFSTGNSFDAVYAWYKKNLPGGSERSLIRFPEKTAVFLVGPASSGLSVTIAASVVCCKTLIIIAQPKN